MSRWNSWLPTAVEPPDIVPPLGLAELRCRMAALLDDCDHGRRDAIKGRVLRASSAHELWLARTEVYQLVAREHCESLAAQRINALMPLFEGRIPPRMLRAI